MKDTKGCRLGRGKSWMGQAEASIYCMQVCELTELMQTMEWERVGKVPKPIPASEIKLLIQENSKPQDIMLSSSQIQ